ncbi:hypothetical protein HK099_002128 [Clydaea vesicula]|uniref:Rgp1-domain-containing protein n=1 Tax=Clydaea vesicula TaxID=447962 RepID=A0AAD5U663_9FUNG|nr:hypothetical protein HK099_002128 [Clydaea vesicula]
MNIKKNNPEDTEIENLSFSSLLKRSVSVASLKSVFSSISYFTGVGQVEEEVLIDDSDENGETNEDDFFNDLDTQNFENEKYPANSPFSYQKQSNTIQNKILPSNLITNYNDTLGNSFMQSDEVNNNYDNDYYSNSSPTTPIFSRENNNLLKPSPQRDSSDSNWSRTSYTTNSGNFSNTSSPKRLNTNSALQGSDFGVFQEREEIAWAFAQMNGHFSVDSTFIRTQPFEPLKSKLMYKTAGGAGGGSSGGGSLGLPTNNSTHKNLPIFSTPPSILFSNLELFIGETKTYRYEIELPPILPASHRGKVVHFTYKLTVGVYRKGKKESQVFQIPFRLFSRTEENGSRPLYEIMNPCIINKDVAIVTDISNVTESLSAFEQSRKDQGFNLKNEDPGTPTTESCARSSISNILLACQFAKKVSYDICKNNEPVAQVLLLRSTYRLGETVTGVINFANSTIPCYQISLFLENCETIELPYALQSKLQTIKQTRRVYSEHHKNVLNAKRCNINLNIPIFASPDISTTLASVNWCLRMEFITGLKETLMESTTVLSQQNTSSTTSLNSKNNINTTSEYGEFEGGNSGVGSFTHYQGLKECEVEVFDCVVNLKVLGNRSCVKLENTLFNIS